MPRILQYQGRSPISKAIRFLTWSSVSHTAWEMDDGRVIEAWHNPAKVRILENYAQGHTPGTVVKAYAMPYLSSFQSDQIEMFLLQQVGKPYNFKGAIRFVNRHDSGKYDPETFDIETYNPPKWFCSELVYAAMLHSGYSLIKRVPPWRVSPALLNISPRLILEETLTIPRKA